jgi:cytochrome P450
MLLEILQRPQLLAQVRDLIQPYVSWDSADPSQLKVDVPKLCSLPLLQSIYAEVLRLRSGSVISRIPNCEDLHIGPWNFNKDEPIIASSYHSGRDETVWNQGTAAEPHSVDEFWAERFIVDPNDARSGPVLTYTLNENGADGQQSPRFSLDGTAGSWLPFGGGARMCPGRHFAKAEMIVTTAIFLTAFDIELLTEGTSVKHDLSYFMFGVMHPEGKVPARIRRRGRA